MINHKIRSVAYKYKTMKDLQAHLRINVWRNIQIHPCEVVARGELLCTLRL